MRLWKGNFQRIGIPRAKLVWLAIYFLSKRFTAPIILILLCVRYKKYIYIFNVVDLDAVGGLPAVMRVLLDAAPSWRLPDRCLTCSRGLRGRALYFIVVCLLFLELISPIYI